MTLQLPDKEQVACAVKTMRKAHFARYKRWPRDYYLEVLFWAGFFAVYLKQKD